MFPDTLQTVLAADGNLGIGMADGHSEVLAADGDLGASGSRTIAGSYNVDIGGIIRELGGGCRLRPTGREEGEEEKIS